MATQYQEFTTPGTSSFTVPSGVTSITVECIGAGGAGGLANGFGLGGNALGPAYGGGGAGGSYARKTLSVLPGQIFSVIVAPGTNGQASPGAIYGLAPSGSPSFVKLQSTSTDLVKAVGGSGGGAMSVQNDDQVRIGIKGYGSTGGSIGDVLYRGGNGGGREGGPLGGGLIRGPFMLPVKCSYTGYSGPGGGGAGYNGNGGDVLYCTSSVDGIGQTYSIGGLGNPVGGNGANAVPEGNKGNNGFNYGGGGSGGAIKVFSFGTRYGGAGAQGYVKISWDADELSCRSLYTSLACCPIAVGCSVYSNPQLTTAAPNGYYWDGTQCWVVLNGVIDSIGSCTTTSTTTTTTTLSGFYYIAVQQDCPSCNSLGSLVVYSPSALTIGGFYGIGDGYSYNIVSSTPGPSYSVDLTGAASNTSCFNICVT
jgi:hypothetical protein